MGIQDILGKIRIPQPITEGLAPILANKYLNGIGEITSLKVNKSEKLLAIDIILKGESSSIKVDADYKLEEKDEGLAIVLNNLNSSREWMKLLFDKHFAGKPVVIPEKYASIVKMVLG